MSSIMSKYFNSCFDFFKDKDKEMISVCKVCGSKKYSQLYKHPHMQIVKCINCDFIWNLFQPTIQVLEDFYKESDSMSSWAKIKTTTKELLRQKEKFSKIYDYINKNRISSILDVGCGNGYFLNNSGCPRVIGIESNLAATQKCKFIVYDHYKEFVESKDAKDKFSMITMFGVLEHVKDPKGFILQYKDYLKKNGTMAIIVPNVESAVVQHLKGKTATFCPQHLWYFSIKTLENLMNQCGLKLVDWHTVEAELQPILKNLNNMEPYSKEKVDFKNRFFSEENLLRNNLGYKICSFFRGK